MGKYAPAARGPELPAPIFCKGALCYEEKHFIRVYGPCAVAVPIPGGRGIEFRRGAPSVRGGGVLRDCPDLDDPVPEFATGETPENIELYYPDYELWGAALGDDLPAKYDSRNTSQTPAKS